MLDTKAVRAHADNWDHDEREFMQELVHALRQCADEIELLRAIGQKSIETIEWQRREKEVLRELVREAMPYIRTLRSGGMAGWNERAEKALEQP